MKKRAITKRATAILLAFALQLGLLTGCAQSSSQTTPQATLAEDDTDTSALTMWIPTTGRAFNDLTDMLQETYPDITFEKDGYSGANTSGYIFQRFEQGELSDIIITTYVPEDGLQEEHMLDLSGYDFVQNYKASVLNNLSVNGKIYFLEGPSIIRGIAYNKTLFEEMGWEVPTSHEEFIALVKQIREETNIMPLSLPGKHAATTFMLMSELAYCDFLQTPDGAEWEQKFANGEASSEEGFATGVALLQDWVDAGVFEEAQTTCGDSDDYQMLVDRECAMAYVMGKQSQLVELTDASEDEYGTFPFYGYGEDSDFCATGYGLKIGLNKSLGEPGNEEKLEKALKLLELFSTEEGQMVAYTGAGDVLTLRDTDSELPELFDGLADTIDRGHTAQYLYTGYTDILAAAGEYMMDICMNGGDLSGVFAVMDEQRKAALESTNEGDFAQVTETLDERQTAQFTANALNAQGLGDFALVSMGKYEPLFDVSGGANGKMYAGGIDSDSILIPLTKSNSKNVITLSLTGKEVRELLEAGRVLRDEEGNTAAFEYFVSGITVERSEDGSVKSISLNGEPIGDDTEYTVVFLPDDVSDDFAEAEQQDTGIVWRDAFREYIIGLGEITPEDAE